MKILVLCNKSPYPPKEGGPIAMNAMIEGLINAGHKVKVLAINTNKYSIDPKDIPKEYLDKTGFETVYIDLSIRPLAAFLNLFTRKSFHVQRFISENFNDKLTEILKSDVFDIIQLETLYISPYLETIRKHSRAKIVLRSHNIEHLIWERITLTCKNPLKKIYLGHLTRTLKNYELSMINHYDGVVTITSKDGDYFVQMGCRKPVIAIPFGIDTEKWFVNPSVKTEFPSLFHIGAMNWMPNEEGIRWFIGEVWPLVTVEFPYLKCYLAGRAMPSWLLNTNLPNLEVVGEVDSAVDFVSSKAIAVVPLFSGSGIRIKIIEAMAAGKVVISTSIGAEGIRVENGKNILIADTPDEYVEAVRKCVQDETFCRSIGENAQLLVKNEHSNDQLISELGKFYERLIFS